MSAFAAPAGSKGTTEIELLSLSSNDAVDEALALTDALRHALLSAPHLADAGKSRALEAVALTAGCDDPMAPACGPKLALELKSDRFVYGTVKKNGPTKYTVTLAYFASGALKSAAKTYDIGTLARDGAAPELKKLAAEVLYQLAGSPRARVDVTVTGPGSKASGDLFEAGVKIGRVEAGRGSVDLPLGKHTIELRADGFLSTSGTVELSGLAGALTLTPTKGGGLVNDLQLYGGIGAMGLGAIFIGVGIATSASIKSSQDDDKFKSYRKRWPASEGDTCARAKEGKESPTGGVPGGERIASYVAELCDSSSSKLTSQYIFYGLGGALIAGGVTLVLLRRGDKDVAAAPDSTKPGHPRREGGLVALEVAPSVSPGFGGFSLSGRF